MTTDRVEGLTMLLRAKSLLVSSCLVTMLVPSLITLGAGEAQASVGAYRPLVKKVALSAPTGLAASAQHLYVTDGNAVKVYDAGTRALVTTVAGVFGATSPVLLPGQATLLVAAKDGSAVQAISTTTNQVTATGTTAACPRSLQVTATTLWYVGDCSAPYHVYTLPLDTLVGSATAVPGLATYSDSRTSLRVSGSTLALASTTMIDTYNIASDNSLSPGTSIAVTDTGADFVLSVDSLFIANMANYDYQRYSLSSGLLTGSYSTGPYPRTLAVSPDGLQLGAGIDGYYDDGLFVFDANSGDAVVHGPVDVNQPSFAEVESVAFSPNGKELYAVARYWTGGSAGYLDYLVTSTTSTPSRIVPTLSVHSPSAVGKSLTATVRVTNNGQPVAHASVTLNVKDSNGDIRQVKVKTSATGVAHDRINVVYSGTVQATASGGLNTIGGSSGVKRYVTHGKFKVAMSHAARVAHGVHYYTSATDVLSFARLMPHLVLASVHVQMQVKSGSHWVTVDTVDLRTNSRSAVAVHVLQAPSGAKHRFTYAFGGDRYLARTSATSPSFVVTN